MVCLAFPAPWEDKQYKAMVFLLFLPPEENGYTRHVVLAFLTHWEEASYKLQHLSRPL